MRESSLPLMLPEVLSDEHLSLGGELPPNCAEQRLAAIAATERWAARRHAVLTGGHEPDADPQLHELAKEQRRCEAEYLQALLGQIHSLPAGQQRWALCLSGGGIRSATFALGVLQGLAHQTLLDRFDYLSTVSGGGYIGSWLTGWLNQVRKDENGQPRPVTMRDIMDELTSKPQCEAHVKIEPEASPVRYLRDFSNYLAPRTGLFSADTWALVATVLRNLLLNWLVIVPLLMAVLLLPSLAVAVLKIGFGEPFPKLIFATGLICGMIGVAYLAQDLPYFGNARFRQRQFLLWCLGPLVTSTVLLTLGAYALLCAHKPLPIAAAILGGALLHGGGWLAGMLRHRWTGPSAHQLRRDQVVSTLIATFSGALAGAGGYFVLSFLLAAEHFSTRAYVCLSMPALLLMYSLAGTLAVGLTSGIVGDEDREWWARAGGWTLFVMLGWTLASAAVLYGPVLFMQSWDRIAAALGATGAVSGSLTIWLGKGAATMAHGKGDPRWRKWALELAAPVFLICLIVWLAASVEHIARLLAAFAPATLADRAGMDLIVRLALVLLLAGIVMLTSRLVNVNKFSLHAMYRSRLIRAYLGASREQRNPSPFTGFDPQDDPYLHSLSESRPLHIVNVALNLVKGERLAWQQRKAESFTFSRLHAGSFRLGYRSASQYGGPRGVSLGTAMAISGAAASPNMGYHSSPLVTFLMTLFNARLGWWLGNPGPAGEKTWRLEGPIPSALPLFQEALGLTNDANPYIYLSDGGHFENLGLYEMVLRRCAVIVVSDAGCDCSYAYEDLANAVRKIRVDLGIPIVFQHFPLRTGETACACHCAVGEIQYRCIDGEQAQNGVLIYIKPVLTASEPPDVKNYAASDKLFPHQPTSDQFFDEAQFESYRRLGQHTIEHMIGLPSGAANVQSPDEFLERVRAYASPEPGATRHQTAIA